MDAEEIREDIIRKRAMKCGMYALREAVVNPKPDRRKRGDWTAQERYEAGERFHLRAFTNLAPEIRKLGLHGSVTLFSDAGNALVPALEPVEPTVNEALKIREVWCPDVLVRLIETRLVTLAQVEAIQQTLEDECEANDKNRGKTSGE